MTSAAMTTAVQPTELVFEFASNGMDEINQVRITLEKLHFEILNPIVCCLYARLGLLSVFFKFDQKTSGPVFDDPSFFFFEQTDCDLVDKCKIFS